MSGHPAPAEPPAELSDLARAYDTAYNRGCSCGTPQPLISLRPFTNENQSAYQRDRATAEGTD